MAAHKTSPLIGKSLMVDKIDLDAVNEWATQAGLRNNLTEWVVHGLEIVPDVATELSITHEKAESPRAATVILTQDGFLDDAVRGARVVLQFERKPCVECGDGGPWTLVSLEATQRCRKGRGQQDYGKGVCS